MPNATPPIPQPTELTCAFCQRQPAQNPVAYLRYEMTSFIAEVNGRVEFIICETCLDGKIRLTSTAMIASEGHVCTE